MRQKLLVRIGRGRWRGDIIPIALLAKHGIPPRGIADARRRGTGGRVHNPRGHGRTFPIGRDFRLSFRVADGFNLTFRVFY